MLICPEHGTKLNVRNNGQFCKAQTYRVECRKYDCTALSGPVCRRCLPTYHVNLLPCAAPADEKPWMSKDVQHFTCVKCGDKTWRSYSELDRLAALEVRLASFYSAT